MGWLYPHELIAYQDSRIISYVATFKQKDVLKFQEASSKLREAQQLYSRVPKSITRQKWKECKAEYDLWLAKYELSKANFRTLQYHRFTNKVGKLMSHLIKGSYKPTIISALRDTQGNLVSSPDQVNPVFHAFYSKLYTADVFHAENAKRFLSANPLPKLSLEQLDKLNASVTATDIFHTIQNLSNVRWSSYRFA